MDLFSVSTLKSLCSKYGLSPSKKYGQNFLIEKEPIVKMLAAAEIKKTDTVVEVGPGFGALTFALAERAGRVVAFEIEKKLQPYWDSFCHSERSEESLYNNVEIVWGNVLRSEINFEKYKVVANLPYQITSNVLHKFLETENKPQSMTLMVQKEVAERICAKPGDMSLLAVSVQFFAEPEIIAQVPKSFFWPEPKVDSAVVRLAVMPGTRSDDEFFRLVRAGFAQRRKFLIKNLQSVAPKKNLEKIFSEMGLAPNIRAQELSVQQWQRLSTSLRREFVV